MRDKIIKIIIKKKPDTLKATKNIVTTKILRI